MKHTVELRLPKLFGRKKKEQEQKPEVTTKVFLEEETKEISVQVIAGVTLAVGLTAGYLVGHMKGVSKGGVTYIFKD